MIRRTLLFMLPVAGVLLCIFLFFRLTPLAINGVKTVNHPLCGHSGGVPSRLQANWQADELVLDIEEPKNCAYSLAGTATQRIGSRLFVRSSYVYPNDGTAAGCSCGHKFTIAIPGLPRQEYTATVYSWP